MRRLPGVIDPNQMNAKFKTLYLASQALSDAVLRPWAASYSPDTPTPPKVEALIRGGAEEPQARICLGFFLAESA